MFCLLSIRTKIQDSRKQIRKCFHFEEFAAPSHRRACAGVHSLFAVSLGLACTKQVSWAPLHMQMGTLHSCFWHQHTHLHTRGLQGVHMRSLINSGIKVEDEGGEVDLVYGMRLLLGVVGIFDKRRDGGVLCVSSIFWRGRKCMRISVCVYTHTHTLHMRYSSTSHYVSPRVVTRHLEGPKSPDRLNLGIYVFVYTTAHGTHFNHICWEAA